MTVLSFILTNYQHQVNKHCKVVRNNAIVRSHVLITWDSPYKNSIVIESREQFKIYREIHNLFCVAYYSMFELILANRILSTFSKRNVLVPFSTPGECLFDVLGILCHPATPGARLPPPPLYLPCTFRFVLFAVQ